MCLQLGSVTNQLGGVNKMVLIRQTSEFGHVLLRSLANRGWGLFSTISLILVIIFHNVLSQTFASRCVSLSFVGCPFISDRCYL